MATITSSYLNYLQIALNARTVEPDKLKDLPYVVRISRVFVSNLQGIPFGAREYPKFVVLAARCCRVHRVHIPPAFDRLAQTASNWNVCINMIDTVVKLGPLTRQDEPKTWEKRGFELSDWTSSATIAADHLIACTILPRSAKEIIGWFQPIHGVAGVYKSLYVGPHTVLEDKLKYRTEHPLLYWMSVAGVVSFVAVSLLSLAPFVVTSHAVMEVVAKFHVWASLSALAWVVSKNFYEEMHIKPLTTLS